MEATIAAIVFFSSVAIALLSCVAIMIKEALEHPFLVVVYLAVGMAALVALAVMGNIPIDTTEVFLFP